MNRDTDMTDMTPHRLRLSLLAQARLRREGALRAALARRPRAPHPAQVQAHRNARPLQESSVIDPQRRALKVLSATHCRAIPNRLPAPARHQGRRASLRDASWSQLGSRWHDLTRPSDRLDPALARAAAEVRAAYRELTHNVTTQANPEAIATRPGLGHGVAASLDALASASELAHGVAEQADRNDLTGPARALSRRAHNDVEAGLATADLDNDQVWVSPADILAKRHVPLPPPVVETLLRVSAEVTQNASAASAAARSQSQSRASNTAEEGSTTERQLPGAPVAPRRAAVLDRSR